MFGSKAMMTQSGGFGGCNQLNATSRSRTIRMDFNSDGVVALGDVWREFRARKIDERVGDSRPAAVDSEVERHVWSEVRKEFDPEVGSRMEASAGAGEEEAEEGNILDSGTTQNPID
jgi:hypothetical protein